MGLDYIPPPENTVDIFNISEKDFNDLKNTDLAAARWLGRSLGLPKKYVEGIFKTAKIDSKKIGNQLNQEEITLLFETSKKIISDVSSGKHKPIIVRNEKTEVLPINLEGINGEIKNVDSFIEGLDLVFTENLVERGKSLQSTGSDKKIKELQTQISEQTKAIELVNQRSKSITMVANSLYEMIASGITSINNPQSAEILSKNNAKMINEKGVWLMVIEDEKIKIKIEASLQSIASVLFDEAKKQSGAINSIEEIRTKTKKKLEKLLNKSESERDSIQVSEIRKKNWYERYRWFFTSDGFLVIGGRDAASNSAVIRKHLGKNDKIFHGDIFGSPFFILKDAENVPDTSMNEVAHATVCFSRAWREGMYGLSAFWVNPDQVKRSAPSGQFLPKGSFTIEGQRNFIKAGNLKLSVGIIPQDEDFVITCGPPETIRKNSICFAIIEPHGNEMVDSAKQIRIEFLKIHEEIVKKISIDEFVRILPAGKSKIVEVSAGEKYQENLIEDELD